MTFENFCKIYFNTKKIGNDFFHKETGEQLSQAIAREFWTEFQHCKKEIPNYSLKRYIKETSV